jgi:hypothetical protein
VLEHPERTSVTGADGHFLFEGLEVGDDATLTLEHPDYHRIQTGTLRLEVAGAERVTFQAVNPLTYWGMGLLVGMIPDERNKCQMVTTVTRVGKSLYDEGAHGEEGATVTIDPPLPPENGPIYFGSNVLPDPSLTETSDDGGVVFVQVPPGEYTWTATKPGVRFAQVRMKCRAGWLVNASPPWGAAGPRLRCGRNRSAMSRCPSGVGWMWSAAIRYQGKAGSTSATPAGTRRAKLTLPAHLGPDRERVIDHDQLPAPPLHRGLGLGQEVRQGVRRLAVAVGSDLRHDEGRASAAQRLELGQGLGGRRALAREVGAADPLAPGVGRVDARRRRVADAGDPARVTAWDRVAAPTRPRGTRHRERHERHQDRDARSPPAAGRDHPAGQGRRVEGIAERAQESRQPEAHHRHEWVEGQHREGRERRHRAEREPLVHVRQARDADRDEQTTEVGDRDPGQHPRRGERAARPFLNAPRACRLALHRAVNQIRTRRVGNGPPSLSAHPLARRERKEGVRVVGSVHLAPPGQRSAPRGAAMLRVHHLENSRSQRILWLLEELAVPYEVKRYARDPKSQLAPPELTAVHPLGKSPVITDGDATIAESGAIVEYLVDTYGNGRLRPAAGTPEMLRYRYWLHACEGSMMPLLVMKLVFSKTTGPPVPFLVRPITKAVAAEVGRSYIDPVSRRSSPTWSTSSAPAPGSPARSRAVPTS